MYLPRVAFWGVDLVAHIMSEMFFFPPSIDIDRYIENYYIARYPYPEEESSAIQKLSNKIVVWLAGIGGSETEQIIVSLTVTTFHDDEKSPRKSVPKSLVVLNTDVSDDPDCTQTRRSATWGVYDDCQKHGDIRKSLNLRLFLHTAPSKNQNPGWEAFLLCSQVGRGKEVFPPSSSHSLSSLCFTSVVSSVHRCGAGRTWTPILMPLEKSSWHSQYKSAANCKGQYPPLRRKYPTHSTPWPKTTANIPLPATSQKSTRPPPLMFCVVEVDDATFTRAT